eukprot:CAMPEP_0116045364 /NCGR_PEP_ID=MMETSP0321-20121206/27574_1 /TAXON_ID=163516 /ORGANISM="Leptocylindrus danicus var. danicus, Strain B650" /LENGTH=275 /DNA_ID=CAMNT_0003526683 /DNA_START=142 /DNA_END=969 /DNA_ORIENTATION=-
MSEGGTFAWKCQKLNVKPTLNMKDILNPLPALPKGYVWSCDEETRTWSIQKDENYDSSEDDNSSDGSLPSVHSPGIPNPVNGREYSREYAPPSCLDFATAEENEQQQKAKMYVEHVVMPTDTLQGLCLKYKVKPVKLRQVNRFSGSTLACAPQILYIPVSKEAFDGGAVKVQDRNSDDFKLYSLIANFPSLRFQEARAYLDMNDWNIDAAMKECYDDLKWEASMIDIPEVHTGVVSDDEDNESAPLLSKPLLAPYQRKNYGYRRGPREFEMRRIC